MTIRNLEAAFRPQSVAVLGGSARAGSVGAMVLHNILAAEFPGAVYPVNPKYDEVMGLHCYRRIGDLPAAPDLAVIVTPPETVPGIIAELGEKGARAAVVLSAGLTAANGLRQEMLDAARPFTLRVIGPNTIGILSPVIGLNASFAHMAPQKGRLALISQSGAIATSLIDWAAEEGVGFSHILSLGDMADVDIGDCLDMLARDPDTRAILMYLESVPAPRKFMSAARAAARMKPVIAIKSGRHAEAAKAAATHTGALSGADKVVDAAMRRAGILRVRDLSELFLAAETIAHYPAHTRARVAIVTNGGGAGVLAVDQLADEHSALAELAPETLAGLDGVLPPTWSHANPVDIIGDAPPARYEAAVRLVAADPDVDAVLVMNCPTALASPSDAAAAVAALATNGMIGGKPVLACWLGEYAARAARRTLQNAGIASFDTPAEAARAIGFLKRWTASQQALSRVPASHTANTRASRKKAAAIIAEVAREGRRMLTEVEAKNVCAAYNIPTPDIAVATDPDEVFAAAQKQLESAAAVVVKLLSREITHKSDVGGVVLGLESATAAKVAAQDIVAAVAEKMPGARIDGFTVQPMIDWDHAHELIVGVSSDPIFGPTVLFGAGGTAVEVVDDTAIALPPLDDVLGRDLIDQTRIGKLLHGYRDRPAADAEAIVRSLNEVAQMVVDFPEIASIDINPLIADETGVIALDARIEIDPARAGEAPPNPDLALKPYPAEWERNVDLPGGNHIFIRPVVPADFALFPAYLARTSTEDIRMRFLAPRRHFSDDTLKRLTQLDYDREMAFAAVLDNGEIGGVARLASDPDREMAEYGVLIRSDLQGRGMGWALLDHLIAYARAEHIGRIEGVVLKENTRMLHMCEELGFELAAVPDDPTIMRVVIGLDTEAAPRRSRA